MNILLLCLHLFTYSILSDANIINTEIMQKVTQESSEIQLLVNDQPLQPYYSKQPTMKCALPETMDIKDVRLVLLNIENDEVEVSTSPWIKKASQWEITWKIQTPHANIRVMLKQGNTILYTSDVFTILKEPTLSINQKVIHDNLLYLLNEKIELQLNFHVSMNPDTCAFYLDDEKMDVEWDEEKQSLTFKTSLDGKHHFSYVAEFDEGIVWKDSIEINIDQQAPLFSVFVNEQKTKSFDSYYAQNIHVRFYVEDTNFDEKLSTLKVNQKLQSLKWKKVDEGYESYLDFTDGTYELIFTGIDKAKNEIVKEYDTFTIDTNKPIAKLQLANPTIFSSQQLQMQIEEKNLDKEQSFFIYRKDGEWNKQALSSLMKQDGMVIKTFQQEGIYEVHALLVDLAGNKTTTETLSFEIDKTPPDIYMQIKQKDIMAGSRYQANHDVEASIQMKDQKNFTYEIQIYQNTKLINVSNTTTTFNFQAEKDKNKEYEIVVLAKDQAGNENKCHFSIGIYTKKTPIVIANDVFQKKPYANSWTPEIKMESDGYRIIHTILRRNEQTLPYQWGTPIEEEGDYALEVLALDEALNTSTLQEAFHFTIDKTAPIVELYGDGKKLNDTFFKGQKIFLRIEQKDKIKQKEEYFVYVKVNDQFVENIKGLHYSFLADQAETYHIECQIQDQAGNITNKQWTLHQIQQKDVSFSSSRTNKQTLYGILSAGFVIWFCFLTGFFKHVARKK